MTRGKSLAKNTFIIFLGTMGTKLVTFLLLPLYTGILSTEEYGIVDLLNTIICLMIPIITFQVEQAVFRELIEARGKKNKTIEVISNGVISILIQSIISVIFLLIILSFIKNEYKIFLVLNLFASIFTSLFLQISRGIGDNKIYSFGSFVSAITTIIFNILFLVVFKLRVEGMLLGTLIGQIVCGVYLFLKLKLYDCIKFNKFKSKSVKKLWKYSFPLIPNAISWWIFGSSDRLIVSSFLGLSMTGILSAASKFSGAYTIIYNVFDRSWIESISLHIDDNDIEEYFNSMFNKIFRIFASISIMAICVMPFVYSIMIDESYIYGYKIVPILLIAALFNVVQGLIVVIYAAKKDTKSIAKTSMVAALLNIIIHFLLIKFIGLYAAAFSTLGAYFIIAIYRLIDVRKKYLNIKFDRKLLIKLIIIFSLEIITYYKNNLYLNVFVIMVCSVIVLKMNQDLLEFVIDKIKLKKKIGG